MEKVNSIDVLNTLVEINNDRIEGYKKAIENTEERDLKDLFSTFQQTSRKCQADLISEINRIGGKATVGTTASGKFFRGWMDVKSVLTGNDRKSILNSCEYGEENANETYQRVLEEEIEHLSPQQQSMIKAQRNLIKADESKIKSLLNNLVEAS